MMGNTTNKIHFNKMQITNLLLNDFIKNKVNIGCNYLDNDPCMLPFTLQSENLCSIFDLNKTYNQIVFAKRKLMQIIGSNEKILFISPDNKFNDLIKDTASQLDMPVIFKNYPKDLFENICLNKSRKKKIEFLEKLIKTNTRKKLSHFEMIRITETIEILSNSIKNKTPLNSLPDAIFIIDPIISYQAIDEAQKYDVLIFSIVNSNSSPLGIDYFIPGNNQNLKSVETIFRSIFSDLIQEKIYQDENIDLLEDDLPNDDITFNFINDNVVFFKGLMNSIITKIYKFFNDK